MPCAPCTAHAHTPCTPYTVYPSQTMHILHFMCSSHSRYASCINTPAFCLDLPHHVRLPHEYISHKGPVFLTVYTRHAVSASQTSRVLCYVPPHIPYIPVCASHAVWVHLTCRTQLPPWVHTTPVPPTAHVLCWVHRYLGPSVNACLHLCVSSSPPPPRRHKGSMLVMASRSSSQLLVQTF